MVVVTVMAVLMVMVVVRMVLPVCTTFRFERRFDRNDFCPQRR